MITLETYLRQILGIKVNKPQSKSHKCKIDCNIQSNNFIHFSEIIFHCISVIVAALRPDIKIAVSEIIAEYRELRAIHNKPILIEFATIDSASRKLLLGNHINFVVPGQQLYFPELYISLKESGNIKEIKPKTLSLPAQVLLLYHLQRKSLADIPLSEIASIIGYTPKTLSLVAAELTHFCIAKLNTQKDHTKSLHFYKKGVELWKQVSKYMQNPIARHGWIYGDIAFLEPVKCGLVVANSNVSKYYALGITLNEARKNDIRLYVENGETMVYLWRYNPRILADKEGCADILSMALSHRSSVHDSMDRYVSKVQWADI